MNTSGVIVVCRELAIVRGGGDVELMQKLVEATHCQVAMRQEKPAHRSRLEPMYGP